MNGLSNPLGENTRWNYDQGDELTGQSLANDLAASYGYDPLGATSHIDYTQAASGTPVAKFDALTYDGASNLTAATVSGIGLPLQGSLAFTHDGQDRILGEQSPYADLAYGYDLAGNTT